MKGLILAGGHGTRLQPATFAMNKHMIPILNNPMIVYPLRTLISFKISDIMIVTGGEHIGAIAEFLGDGSQYGVNLTYRVQREAGGIAQALGLAEKFVGDDDVMVILGDNIFDDITNSEEYDHTLNVGNAAILVKDMPDASRFGVLTGGSFSGKNRYRIIEKPKDVKRGHVVTGLYIYPPSVFNVVKTLKPSRRGELEITDVNNYYLLQDKARIYYLHNKFWSDAGTPESLKTAIDWAYERRT